MAKDVIDRCWFTDRFHDVLDAEKTKIEELQQVSERKLSDIDDLRVLLNFPRITPDLIRKMIESTPCSRLFC